MSCNRCTSCNVPQTNNQFKSHIPPASCVCKCDCPSKCKYPVKNISCLYQYSSKLKPYMPIKCPEPIQQKKCVYGCRSILNPRRFDTGCGKKSCKSKICQTCPKFACTPYTLGCGKGSCKSTTCYGGCAKSACPKKGPCCSYGTTGKTNLNVCKGPVFKKKYSNVCPTDPVCCSTVLDEEIVCDPCKKVSDEPPNCKIGCA